MDEVTPLMPGRSARRDADPAGHGVEVRVLSDAVAVAETVTCEIMTDMETRLEEGSGYLLGCPGGRTFQPTYRALARLAARQNLDWSNVIIVMIDDYLDVSGSGLTRCAEDLHYSCYRFGRKEIIDLINGGLPEPARIPLENLWVPDPIRPTEVEERIKDAGGVDIFLIASGASDGHVGFNPSGTRLDSLTRVIELAESTRADNLSTFPDFAALDEVPTHGVSLGLGTIVDLSRRAIMVLTGTAKTLTAKRILGSGEFDPTWPATFIYECPQPSIYLDRTSLASVDRFRLKAPG